MIQNSASGTQRHNSHVCAHAHLNKDNLKISLLLFSLNIALMSTTSFRCHQNDQKHEYLEIKSSTFSYFSVNLEYDTMKFLTQNL